MSMNTNTLLRMTGYLAAALLAQLQLPAQPWQTVDDFQYTSGKTAFASGMGADALGNIYSVGSGSDAANISHALVMRSGDQGATWQTIEDYNYLPGSNTCFVCFGVDPAQNLYAAGWVKMGTSGTRWLVRRSTDLGATWQTVDDFPYASGWYNLPQGIAADNSGNIYIAGGVVTLSGPQAGNYRWLVRRSADGGATWATVDVYQYNGYATKAIGVVTTPAGVFVAGFGGLHWIVRKSVDGGQTWSIVNDYAYPSASGSGMGGLTVDNAGNLFTAGEATVTTVTKHGSTTQYYWVVRKGINGGTAWSNVCVSPNAAFVDAMGSDAAGNVYVVGGPNWAVWKGSNQGTTWSTLDNFLYGSSSRAYGCASDDLGNVYVCGSGTEPATGSHWLVRKATP